jgi:DNA-binding NarL/FixJ family response regulator
MAPQVWRTCSRIAFGDLEDLVRALHEVVSGGSVVDPLIIDTLVARQQTRASSPLASLTPRELDVLREMAPGQDQRRY